MISKSINEISIQDFQDLINNGVTEGKTIEYKQELHLINDNDKKEFLYDVSAFANASGGDLIFGIIEDRETGIPKEVKGISISNYDEEVRKIESLIRDGIAPRLTGIEIRKYDVADSKLILLIRIPKGWNAPHQVTFRGVDKFYTRSANGKYKLDVLELRNAFLFSETIVQTIRSFREDRIMKIIANEGPVNLKANAKIMVQLVPLAAFQSNVRYDLKEIANHTVGLRPLDGSSRQWRYNLEGMLAYGAALSHQVPDSYIQVFFNGIIETVSATILAPYDNKLLIPAVRGLNYEKEIIEVVKDYLACQERLSVDPPILFFITLMGVKNYVMGYNRRDDFFKEKKVDRDILQLPEVRIDSYSINVEEALKPVFDMIWNACGFDRSYNYDEAGKWNPQQ